MISYIVHYYRVHNSGHATTYWIIPLCFHCLSIVFEDVPQINLGMVTASLPAIHGYTWYRTRRLTQSFFTNCMLMSWNKSKMHSRHVSFRNESQSSYIELNRQ